MTWGIVGAMKHQTKKGKKMETQQELSEKLNELNEAFKDSFMKPEFHYGMFGHYDTGYESVTMPIEYCANTNTVEKIEGYGVRLSASGYLDCTEWSVFDTEIEAVNYVLDTFVD